MSMRRRKTFPSRSAAPFLLAALLPLAALTSCTPSPTQDPPVEAHPQRPPPSIAALIDATCPADGEGILPPFTEEVDVYAGGVEPDGFSAVRVVRCSVSGWSQKDARTIYAVEQLVAPPSLGLQDALALPDLPRPSQGNVACDAKARPILYLMLSDAEGRGFHSRNPTTWCGEPRDEVLRAVDDMSWTTVHSFSVDRG